MSPSTTVVTGAEIAAAERWQALENHLTRWFARPDLEGLRVVIAATVGHYWLAEKPVWLLVVGTPGSGKSEIAIGGLRSLPDTEPVSVLTPRAFLSAFDQGKNKYSLLHRSGPSRIWLMKDFGTLLSAHPHDRQQILANLREIYDGELPRDTGASRKLLWQGKITLIAATTPDYERYWAAVRSLGDRFVAVHWRSPPPQDAGRMAIGQLGEERKIRSELRRLVVDWVRPAGLVEVPRQSTPASDQLSALAELIAWLRVRAHRENDARRTIEEVPEAETPSRIASVLWQIARAHAAINRRPMVAIEDFALARRVALDSIPRSTAAIIGAIPDGSETSRGEILRMTGLPPATVTRRLEELVLMQVVDQQDRAEAIYRFGSRFASLKATALGPP